MLQSILYKQPITSCSADNFHVINQENSSKMQQMITIIALAHQYIIRIQV